MHSLSGQSREFQLRDSLLHHTVVCGSSNFDKVSIVMELSLAYIRSPEVDLQWHHMDNDELAGGGRDGCLLSRAT